MNELLWRAARGAVVYCVHHNEPLMDPPGKIAPLNCVKSKPRPPDYTPPPPSTALRYCIGVGGLDFSLLSNITTMAGVVGYTQRYNTFFSISEDTNFKGNLSKFTVHIKLNLRTSLHSTTMSTTMNYTCAKAPPVVSDGIYQTNNTVELQEVLDSVNRFMLFLQRIRVHLDVSEILSNLMF